MCGICGKLTIDGSPVEEDLLRRMTSALAHRGPDAEGSYLACGRGRSVGLGHRRLSIIDLSEAGRQPMSNEDRTLWMVFNGEIYNFRSLRDELERKGHRFSSKTDGEVILHLYEEEGAGAFRRLSGMFAFALWDENGGVALLCRDRLGIKPLVYCRDRRGLVFASEIKSILQDPGVDRRMDPQALDLYLTFNYIPAPLTIYEGIRKVRPGHYVLFGNGRLREEAYWDLPDPPEAQSAAKGADDLERCKAEVYRTLDEAVRGHMIADVPVAAFLSGGIDSSIVVGLMARHCGRPVRTYSIGFEDMPMFDETAYARDVARLNGTDHHEIRLSAEDVIDAVPRVLEALDEPFADSSAVPTFIVSRETARDVKVALSGDGGDELFAGYRMYTGEHWYSRYRRIPAALRGVLEPLVLALPDARDRRIPERIRRVKKFLRGAKGGFEDRFFAWNEIFPKDLRQSLFLSPNGIDRDSGKNRLAARLQEKRFDDVNRMLYADVKESLPGDMLRKVDAMSMLHSLEVRVPFLDHRVCELAFRIGGDLKIRRGVGKFILVEAFKGILPPSLHRRPKWGFEMPLSAWLKGRLGYLVDEYLSEERVVRQGLFSYPVIRRLREELMTSRSDTSWQIWNLIVFQAWYSRQFGGAGR